MNRKKNRKHLFFVENCSYAYGNLFDMVIKLSEDLYPKESIIKAAYKFTGDYSVFLDKKEDHYYLEVSSFDGKDIDESSLETEIKRELLAQAARYSIMQQTKDLRNIIVGRALASTIIDDTDNGYVNDPSMKASEILTDWFDQHNE